MNVTEQDMTNLIDHIGLVLKTYGGLHSAHERLHKVHDELHECAKKHGLAHAAALRTGRVCQGDALDLAHTAHKVAHERARLQRLERKTDHQRHTDAMARLAGTMKKILGGGPESVTPATDPTKLPNRLDTAKVNARKISPFDRLVKNSQSKPRVFKNARNPLWTG